MTLKLNYKYYKYYEIKLLNYNDIFLSINYKILMDFNFILKEKCYILQRIIINNLKINFVY
jgi:hypothetical protein